MGARRNREIAFVRVIAMFFIIICHIIGNYTFIPGSSALGQLFNVGVEMFILISGYLYGNKEVKNYKNFLWKRYLKVCVPVMLWAFVMFLIAKEASLKVLAVYVLNLQGLGNIHSKIALPNSGLGMRQTWFVTIIMICYLMVLILQKLKNSYTQKQFEIFLIVIWTVSIVLMFFGIQTYYFI